jgi:hypothetical protein
VFDRNASFEICEALLISILENVVMSVYSCSVDNDETGNIEETGFLLEVWNMTEKPKFLQVSKAFRKLS